MKHSAVQKKTMENKADRPAPNTRGTFYSHTYGELPSEAKNIREEVFMREQGFSEELEFDDIDQTAWHIVLTSRGKPVGTGRLFVRNPNRPSVLTI